MPYSMARERLIMRKLTEEQRAKSEARKLRFRQLVKQVAAMSDAERDAMLIRVGAVVTCEGRALSPTNTMLCLMQLPGVSMVGGFKQWIRQGRAVRKGEHGVSIWIPCAGKKAEDSETEGEMYFTSGTVFDVSQTSPLAHVDSVDQAPEYDQDIAA